MPSKNRKNNPPEAWSLEYTFNLIWPNTLLGEPDNAKKAIECLDNFEKGKTAVWSLFRNAIQEGVIRVLEGDPRAIPERPSPMETAGILISQESFLTWYKDKRKTINEYAAKTTGENPWKKFLNKLIRARKAGKRKAGKRPSYLRAPVIQEAIWIREHKGITSAPKIAKMPRITRILAREASHVGLEDIEPEEYLSRFGHSVTTVEGWIRQGFKDTTPK